MSVFKYFKNIPQSPPHRATGSKCNFFFFKFATRSLEKKGTVAPPQATGACRPAHGRPPLGPAHGRGRGACRPPPGDRGIPPIKGPDLPFPPHLSPKIPPKIQKKERSEEKKSGEVQCDQIAGGVPTLVVWLHHVQQHSWQLGR